LLLPRGRLGFPVCRDGGGGVFAALLARSLLPTAISLFNLLFLYLFALPRQLLRHFPQLFRRYLVRSFAKDGAARWALRFKLVHQAAVAEQTKLVPALAREKIQVFYAQVVAAQRADPFVILRI
jgi:hypothetical protein